MNESIQGSRFIPALIWVGLSSAQIAAMAYAFDVAGGGPLPPALCLFWLLLFVAGGAVIWSWPRATRRWRVVRFVAILGAQAAVFDPITWSAAFAADSRGIPYPQVMDTMFAWFGLAGWAAVIVALVWAVVLMIRKSMTRRPSSR